jgi:hypothetical protein
MPEVYTQSLLSVNTLAAHRRRQDVEYDEDKPTNGVGAVARTSEDLLAALTEALADADRVIREAHSATRDLRATLKTERARMEEIVREETRATILSIAEDIRTVTQTQVDGMLAELRARLLGEP